MSNWNPSSIQSMAGSIENYASQIDIMLWNKQRYGIERADDFADELERKIAHLELALDMFEQLDTRQIMHSLRADLRAFRALEQK